MLKIRSLRAARRDRDVALALERATRVASFTENDVREADRLYVVPYCGNVDPANEADLRGVAEIRESVYEAVDRELDPSRSRRHLFLLADTGMGKTTFLLNYFRRESAKPQSKRRPIALVPLGRHDAIEQIKKIERPRDTLLMLDAFDEDAEAIEGDYRARLDEILRAASDFQAILITCRSQFFTTEEEIPRETGILKVSPRAAGDAGTYVFRKLYLLPFDNTQVSRYIRSAFPFYRPAQQRLARTIAERIDDLALRPMLLALLPQLVRSRSTVNELYELYAFMIDSWLTRESRWIQSDRLRQVSLRLAVDLVLQRGHRRSERIGLKDLTNLIDESEHQIRRWELTSRSLLNRDAVGNYKFAHRSILEFLFVEAFVKGDERCATVPWTGFMRDLLLSWGRCKTLDIDRQRAKEILASDLSATKIFPLPRAYPSVDVLDLDSLSPKARFRYRNAGLPPSWRDLTSTKLRSGSVARIYERADGTAWQLLLTTQNDQHDLIEVLKIDRAIYEWRDSANDSWRLPTLPEVKPLLDTLATTGELFDYFDTRQLYWLLERASDRHYFFRVARDTDEVVAVRDLEIHKSGMFFPGTRNSYRLDIYQSRQRFCRVKALPLMNNHFDSNARLPTTADEVDWGVEIVTTRVRARPSTASN